MSAPTFAPEAAVWIADENRWELEAPPDWWLRRLYDYDPFLRIVPSRFRRQYLLARRRQLTAGMGETAMLGNEHPDTLMCMVHGVLPIAPLRWKAGAQHFWTEGSLTSLLDCLRERDLWAHGQGPEHPDRIIERIEAAEAAEEARERRNMIDSFRHRARDAWRSLKARTGQRNKRASDFHGAAQPTGTGLIVP